VTVPSPPGGARSIGIQEIDMQIGTILHIDAHGRVTVQLAERVVHAQILSGGGQRGDSVQGPMKPGLRTWMNTVHRRMIVDVAEG
jgi:hypothetical protein